MTKQYVITGIGTDVGKTVVSAIIGEALKASYWKPVQAGDLSNSDSHKIEGLTNSVNVLPEGYRLSQPMSPHATAQIDGITIQRTALKVPKVDGNLIIEGAGGLMVPLNEAGETYVDLFTDWKLPVIVVSMHYLGSINHTLLTIEVLKNRGVAIEGIVFVGDEHPSTEAIIQQTTGVRVITRIPIAEEVNKAFIVEQADKIAL